MSNSGGQQALEGFANASRCRQAPACEETSDAGGQHSGVSPELRP